MVQSSLPVNGQASAQSINWVESFETVAKAVKGMVKLAQFSTPSDLRALVKISTAMSAVFKTALKEGSQESSCQQRLLSAYMRVRKDLSQVYGAALKNVEKL